MLKSRICLDFIEKTVEKYQGDGQMNYRLYHDSSSASSAFKAREIAAIIYPSMMLLADAEAKKFGFSGGSNIRYMIEQPRNKTLFPLKAANEPDVEMSYLLPFLADICERKLAKQPVLSKIFEESVQTVFPEFRLDQVLKLQSNENIFSHQPSLE